ncbi:MAG: hypothetical protein IIA12_06760 [Proteobacteria bacterium]|nr:hypothetical protein [Pseudomonadota bacterium]
MSSESLDNLVKIGKLKVGPSSDAEITGLVQRGLVKIEDYKRLDLSADSRFDLAYNAAHALCLAALRQAGYRSENRYIVFQCSQHTIGLEPQYWRVLSDAHRERNVAEYEGDIVVNQQLVEALVRVVDIVAERVQELVK